MVPASCQLLPLWLNGWVPRIKWYCLYQLLTYTQRNHGYQILVSYYSFLKSSLYQLVLSIILALKLSSYIIVQHHD